MSLAAIALLVLGLGLIAWLAARARAAAFAAPGVPGAQRPHSRPGQHGWYVAMWTILPALLFLAVWNNVSGNLIYGQVLASPEAAALPGFGMQRQTILNEAYALATGQTDTAFNPQAFALAPVYARAIAFYNWIGLAVAMLVAFAGGAWAFSRVSPHFRARTRVERMVMFGLLRRLADRDPDHVGHRPVAAVRELALLLDGLAGRVPVRDELEPADGDPRRPGRLVGRVRRDAAVLGHDLHRRDHRDDRRHSARADERDLPDPICHARGCAPG